jgi:hypothetical protein
MSSSVLLALALQQPMQVPPKGAIVLFDGKDASAWVQDDGSPCKWNIVDGALEVNPQASSIHTKEEFGDFKLHIEFWLPNLPANVKSQGRANSGVYSHGRYEVQVLDSYKNPTYKLGGVGALYSQKDPSQNAIKPPETWNTYDIEFKAPRFWSDGFVKSAPVITVWHNGKLIHDNVTLTTYWKEAQKNAKNWQELKTGPILLQNHGNKVRFRNIWIVKK